ncbi:fused MFS/spermidine synthase [Candidatus Chlorohelix sp.]|uniref:fused MFS/spermidine synthase n=1 Tax=Candidatus Chlorohelix sp. TaxID=3139201 RepID=UPI003055735B
MSAISIEREPAKVPVMRVPLLLTIVFVCGMSVMAIQMCASRLIAPFFGTSLIIWANLIGFTMIFLATGYYLGGRIADKYPQPAVLYRLIAIAAIFTALIPALSSPLMDLVGSAFKSANGGIFFGSLFSILLLFAVPLALLGCVSPFAVRLRVAQIGSAGKTAGGISSLNTLGSIIGTFIPVLLLIPSIGTRFTIYIFAFALLAFSLVGLYLAQKNCK